MLEVGQKYEVEIEKVNHQCEGLVRVEGVVVFVAQALPDEKVRIEIVEFQKKLARARIVEILKPSPQRVKPDCEYFYRCGGCQIQHAAYAQQIRMKSQLLQEQLQTLGADFEYREFIKSPREFHYRYRSFVPVSIQSPGMRAGYYSPDSHDIVDIENCPQLEPGLNQLYLGVKRFIKEGNFGNIPLRHILVLSSYPAKTYQLGLVWLENEFPAKRDLIAKLIRAFPGVAIGFNYQNQPTNVILGRHWEWLGGAPEMENHFGEVKFFSNFKSFSQVNPAIAEKIYRTLQSEIQKLPRQLRLIDLYGGSGVLAKILSEHFDEVTVVEENPNSINLGQKHFGLGKFVNQTVEKFLAGLKPGFIDATFIINPPRKGCSDETLERLLQLKPQHLFYVSCNPATLVRDLKKLKELYRINWVQGFDMFPQTYHFETLVAMRHNTAQ